MPTITDIETSLEPVEYLARSPSRLELLNTLNEGSKDRNELKESTDVSRVTLSRFLGNFEERGWIERTNGQYEATVEGSFMATEVSRLLANVETLESLDGSIDWLPIDKFDFDLARLQGAEVTTASWSDHTAQMRQVADAIRGSDRIRATASGTSRDVVDALWEATVEGGASFQAVFDETAYDIIRGDAEVLGQIQEMGDQGAKYSLYRGPEKPLIMLMICDDSVLLCGHDQDGPPPGTLETQDVKVLSWAEDYFDSALSEADSVEMK